MCPHRAANRVFNSYTATVTRKINLSASTTGNHGDASRLRVPLNEAGVLAGLWPPSPAPQPCERDTLRAPGVCTPVTSRCERARMPDGQTHPTPSYSAGAHKDTTENLGELTPESPQREDQQGTDVRLRNSTSCATEGLRNYSRKGNFFTRQNNGFRKVSNTDA